jgi:hypothetical protein
MLQKVIDKFEGFPKQKLKSALTKQTVEEVRERDPDETADEETTKPVISSDLADLSCFLMEFINQAICDYSISRRVLAYRTIQKGEVVRYDKDPLMTAYVVSGPGYERKEELDDVRPVLVEAGRYIYPPEREIARDINIRNLWVQGKLDINKFYDQVAQALVGMIREEDVPLMDVLREAAKKNEIKKGAFPKLFIDLKYRVEHEGLPCGFILINRERFSVFTTEIFEKHGVEKGVEILRKEYQIEPEKDRNRIDMGYLGTFMGDAINIISPANDPKLHDIVGEDEVFALPPPAYLGGVPIRIEPITLLEPSDEHAAWSIYEVISQVVVATGGVFQGEWVDR